MHVKKYRGELAVQLIFSILIISAIIGGSKFLGVKVENFIEGIFDKGFSLTEHFLSPIASFSGNRWHMEDREEKEAKPRILDYMRDLLCYCT